MDAARRLHARAAFSASSGASPTLSSDVSLWPPAPIRPYVETLRCERPPPKTSSERGKAFRARRKAQQEAVAQQIGVVTREICALLALKAVYEAAVLRAPHTPQGSLERLVREYYRVFDHGYCDDTGNRLAVQRSLTQTAFVMQQVDEDARIGDAVGRAALIEQWRVYTAAHSKYQGAIQSVAFLGTEDAPIIVVNSKVVTGISMLTFKTMFPHVVRDPAMVARLDGLDVVYDCAARFCFTAEGRIGSADFDIDFIGGLQRAGVSLSDIYFLLRIAAPAS